MAENTVNEKNGKKSKLPIIIIAACVIIILLLIVLIFVIMNKDTAKGNTPYDPVEANMSNGALKYEEAAIVLNEDDLQQKVDEMMEKIEDGYISISHKSSAVSSDGENFECYIENGIENKYDMYINIYKDTTAQEQILLTGLIPPGTGIASFKSEIKLEKGVYDALLVITQVEDDHETIRDNQLLLTYSLVVQ